MAKMCSIVDYENLKAVFNKILLSNQLKPQDVRKEGSKVYIADRGRFECAACFHKWESNFSWITFDLIDLMVTYRWKMKCKFCLMLCQPTFSMDQIENMFEKAVKWYKGDFGSGGIDIGRNAQRERRQPHMPVLCEKCRWGAETCWQRRYC